MNVKLTQLFGGVLLSAMQVACQSSKPIAWEHGWKTDRVTATRYTNKTMGLSIGFKFPKNPNECDRAEISDLIEAQSGSVYQSGGYPGAEMFVVFKDVMDVVSADAKLQKILPRLNKLMDDITEGKKIPKIVNPNAKVWPDTDPPDKTNPYWEFNNNMSVNGTPYKKVEVSPGKWQWAKDEVSMKYMADAQDHRRNLWYALTTRVLTDAELKEVAGHGSSLNIEPMTPYNAQEKLTELQNALLIQQMLRSGKPSPVEAEK